MHDTEDGGTDSSLDENIDGSKKGATRTFHLHKNLRADRKPKVKMSEEAERIILLKQLVIMRKAKEKGGFRNIVLGSKLWHDVQATVTPVQRAAMDAWVYGPLMYVGELRPGEAMILKDMHKVLTQATVGKGSLNVQYPINPEDLTFDSLNMLMFDCEEQKYSWLYIQDLPLIVVQGCNAMLSHFKRNLRLKAEIKTDKGHKYPSVVDRVRLP